MKRPAFQFYPADWRKDAALQSCSLAAQGLWVNVMCIAHECQPYGHLSVNDKPMAPAQLARLVGLSAKECTALLAELEGAGVFSRTDDGGIFSRRMVKDEEVRRARAEGGCKGGDQGHKGGEYGGLGGRPKGGNKPPLYPPPSSSTSSSPAGENSKALSGKPDGTDGDAKTLKGKDLNAAAVRVLDYLNTTCGTGFEAVPSNITMIRARLGEYPEATLFRVVDAKRKEWQGTENQKYLRPGTLFNAEKCAQYVGLLNVKPVGGGGAPAPKKCEFDGCQEDGKAPFAGKLFCPSHFYKQKDAGPALVKTA